jgi:hypothetical protein
MKYPYLILIPLVAVGVTQLLKFIIAASRGQWRWSVLLEYGGMPSAHTAFVISLTTVVGLSSGYKSAAFAIAAVFAIIIIRDAIGLRQFLSEHGRILNMLIKDLPDDQETKYPTHVTEHLGHTPLQATVGGIIGFVIAWSMYTWLVV